MPYTPQTWTNGVSKLNATRMGVIETGIEDATTTAEAAQTTADAAIAESLVDAQGDLIVGTAADTAARLAVGTNNYALVADSAQTGGMKWAQITNAMVDSAAAIAYSKLNLATSIVNADVSASAAIDQTKLASPPMARAKRTSALAITTATWTLLTLDGEDFDTDTIHDTGSNTARLTCKTAGKYAVVLHVVWDTSTAGVRSAIIQKNSESVPGAGESGIYQGGYTIPSAGTAPVTVTTLPNTATALVDLAVNDYLAAIVYQASGGNLDVSVDTYFAMWRVG